MPTNLLEVPLTENKGNDPDAGLSDDGDILIQAVDDKVRERDSKILCLFLGFQGNLLATRKHWQYQFKAVCPFY